MELKRFEHNSPGYWLTVALRDKILRQPLNLTFSDEELQGEVSSQHLALVNDNVVLACLVLKPISGKEIKMRQVAVDTTVQGQGLGSRLVQVAEEYAKDQGFTIISCHARYTAQDFYERLGYQVVGELFKELDIDHFKMIKYFTNLHSSI